MLTPAQIAVIKATAPVVAANANKITGTFYPLMFERFPLSVGVANLADFADRLQHWPAFVTEHERGRGFVEVAEAVLAARRG